MMTVNQLFKEAQKLSKPDRVKLAERLGASVESEWNAPELSALQKKELVKRWELLKRNPKSALTMDEMVKNAGSGGRSRK